MDLLKIWVLMLQQILNKATTRKFFEIVEAVHQNSKIEGILVTILSFQEHIDLEQIKTNPQI